MTLLNRVTLCLSPKCVFALIVASGCLMLVLTPDSHAELKQQPANAQLAGSDFPHAVKFEQGATRFEAGDKIEITEIRGTAQTFGRGNIYLIKGTYTLASQARATLAAYITATGSTDNFGHTLSVQHLKIDRGEGTFTLFLPMYIDGLPHVSFYSDRDGQGFGGNYFETGDFVLKQWWGAK
jgi:hypothetical protein